ncbi:S8 family serine peptidase [Robertkochia solimangrovi]|uniref:S8 family serine peptidase n=1 Tax=Robertkochia solimangrovi TaxID=2213046 RepID=UPI00117F52B5|nr:S8 family serine peptidase [Robertkochia solimangrovi]TRZ45963.1 serine protease [Robertkochia solimangrovi]
MKTDLLKLLVCPVALAVFAFSTDSVNAQSKNECGNAPYYPASSVARLKELAVRFQDRAIANKAEALEMATKKGWVTSKELGDGGFIELQKIGPDGAPVYYTTYNDVVVQTSRSNSLYANGDLSLDLDGTGMLVGVWDSGKALMDHQELVGRVVAGDNSKRVSDHATHVMGTLLAAGVDPVAKGVAYNAQGVSYDWTKDEGEVADAAAGGLLLSNHSYGISGKSIPDWYFGTYIYQAKDWDEIMYNAPYYLMVTAAGNTQGMGYNDDPNYGSRKDGYDLLLGFAVAKNGITVAASESAEIDESGNLISSKIASFSNYGPTDDGRIKPDITGAGVNIYSSYGDATDDYRTMSGTSMASPGVTGALTLLQQYYYNIYGSYMKASTLKGLALHTADEAGDFDGPDPVFGWGIINDKKAATTLMNNDLKSLVQEKSLSDGGTYSFEVTADEGKTLMASISWTDPANPKEYNRWMDSSEAVLVNDLDIRIKQDGKTFKPWKLSMSNLKGGAVRGDNIVDPFEKIEIPNASGTYTITISHKGKLYTAEQDYSIVVTGIKVSDCEADVPQNLKAQTLDENNVKVSWTGSTDALYEIEYKLTDSDEWTTEMTTDEEYLITGLLANENYDFRVRSLCTALIGSDYSNSIEFSTIIRDEVPPTVPLDIRIQMITSYSVEIEWDPSQDDKSDLVLYNIYLDGKLHTKNYKGTKINLNGLDPNRTYQIQLNAVDESDNISAFTDIYSATTLRDDLLKNEDSDDDLHGVGDWVTVTKNQIDAQGYAYNPNILASLSTPTISLNARSGILTVYQNPVNKTIAVDATADNKEYQIFNASGRIVYTGYGFRKNIDVSNYPTGLYIVTVVEDGKIRAKKFMLNK